MKYFYLISLSLLALFLYSCFPQFNEKIEHFPYKNSDIGWIINLPKIRGTKIKTDIDSLKEINSNGMKQLVDIQLDEFNYFYAQLDTSNNYSFKDRKETNYALLDFMLQAALSKNEAKCDTTSGTEIIGGIPFEKFYINMHIPEGNAIVELTTYHHSFKKTHLTITFSYNNYSFEKNIFEALRNSKFQNSN